MLKKVFLGGVVVAASVFSVGASAIVIDDFTLGAKHEVKKHEQSYSVFADVDTSKTHILGGTRQGLVYSNNTTGNPPTGLIKFQPSTAAGKSVYSIDTGAGITSNMGFIWGGGTGPTSAEVGGLFDSGNRLNAFAAFDMYSGLTRSDGSSGFDINGVKNDLDSLVLDVFDADHDYNVTFYLEDASGAQGSKTVRVKKAGGKAIAGLGEFGVNLDRIKYISMVIDGASDGALDTRFSLLATSVPEPATLALFGLGLAGIARLRAKR